LGVLRSGLSAAGCRVREGGFGVRPLHGGESGPGAAVIA